MKDVQCDRPVCHTVHLSFFLPPLSLSWSEKKRKGGGKTNALKIDQCLYGALFDGVGLGATATLAGTIKDLSFGGKGNSR